MYSDVPEPRFGVRLHQRVLDAECDLTCEYVCRLINYMDQHGYRQCTPHNVDPSR